MTKILLERIILASTSKFRQKLMLASGLRVEAHDAGIDEVALTAENPKATAIVRATAKAQSVAKKFPDALVIGADQTLALGEKTFTKARTEREAVATLLALSGRTHHLYSAVSLVFPSGIPPYQQVDEFVVAVPMTMRSLSIDEIEAYVQLGEWQGCVGCYQAENVGSNLFSAIGGDLTAVMGLPMLQLLTRLRRIGVNPLLNHRGPWTLLSKKLKETSDLVGP